MDEDEEVVFTNTALYEHLVSTGYSDFESASCLEDVIEKSTELTAESQQKMTRVREVVLSALDRLSVRCGPLLLPDTLSALLDSGLMTDRDRAMAADLCSDQRQAAARQPVSDPVLWALLAAGVAVAVYLPTPWLLLAAALLLCAGGATVAKLRAAAGRRRVADFCRVASSLRRTGLKCVRLLQESHLMARGVTLSSGEPGVEAAFTAQYGALLEAAGACLRSACAAYGQATRRLRLQQPLMDGVDPARFYVAYDQAAQAAPADSSLTVADVKRLQQLLAECQSEFVRRCCLGLVAELQPPEADSPELPAALLDELSGALSEQLRRLSAAHRAHVALWSEPDPAPEPGPAAATAGRSEPERLYVGVHSACLQAQVAALRARAAEEALSGADAGDRQLYERLRRELGEVAQRLDSGRLFCEQTLLQLSQLCDEAPPPAAVELRLPTARPAAAAGGCLAAELPEPELVDQFFEAVVEGDQPAEDDWEGELLSQEEKLRRRLQKERARQLLKELDLALAPKREEWRIREAVAKGEPVVPLEESSKPNVDQEKTASSIHVEDAYAVDKAELYRFSESEDEEVSPRLPASTVGAETPGRGPGDGYRADRADLHRFSDLDGQTEPAGPLVLPPVADLTHLLAVQRRARPPGRRPPSRPVSAAGRPDQPAAACSPPAGPDGPEADWSGFVSPSAESDLSPSGTGGSASAGPDLSPSGTGGSASAGLDLSPSGTGGSASAGPDPPPAAVPPPPPPPAAGGGARRSAAALGLPRRLGFPADLSAQAAALAQLRRSAADRDGEVFGDDSDTADAADA